MKNNQHTWDYQKYLDNLSESERKHAPKELFWEGDISLLTKGIKVSVVGSRSASENGLARAEIFTKVLVDRDITVVSGLAAGIDTIAHRTAIDQGGKTIAVLGTPLSQAYPRSNAGLLDEIKKDHLAISQFLKPHNSNFPVRNKTMALISDATVIIEASEKSGTQHQGWEALRLGRLLFIMQNVAEDPALTWPKKMIGYGAQILTRENMNDILDLIPHFTSQTDFVY